MDKAKQIYLDFKREAIFLDLDFPLFLGNGPGCGELCMDYSEQDGYMLYGYERGERNSEFKTTDFEEFKYEVFLHICWYMGWNLNCVIVKKTSNATITFLKRIPVKSLLKKHCSY